MRVRAHVARLELAETFTIARGSSDHEDVVQVELEHDGLVGYGEAAPADFLGETVAGTLDFVERQAAAALGDDPFALEEIGRRLAAVPGTRAGRAALDGALHDWVGKRCGQPTWRLLGLSRETPPTSYTIGIDTVEGTADRARRATGFLFLKLKVGGRDDLARLEAVRAAAPAARIRADANQGLTVAHALALLPALAAMGVELLEQPFPSDDLDAWHRLAELPAARRVPLFVDEGCTDLASVAAAARYADGVNIKIDKSGGIREAQRMIHAARALGLRVMLGCMVSSQLGIAQAAQLASLADHVDLDGHLLLTESPFVGLGLEDGRIVLSEEPGLGVRPR
jgi:L-Ala-D/L-Glu epimerase